MTETEEKAEETSAGSPPAKPPESAKKPTRVPRHPVSSGANARLTFAFLGAIFTVTFFAWGGAKVACNHHPPTYQAFKPAPLERLANTPKDAALEFQHRLFSNDFAGARELLLPEAVALVEEAESACDAACRATSELRRETTATRSSLLQRSGNTATATVESHFQQEQLLATYELKFESPIWKVSRRVN